MNYASHSAENVKLKNLRVVPLSFTFSPVPALLNRMVRYSVMMLTWSVFFHVVVCLSDYLPSITFLNKPNLLICFDLSTLYKNPVYTGTNTVIQQAF